MLTKILIESKWLKPRAAPNVFRVSRPLRQARRQTGSGRATLQPSLSFVSLGVARAFCERNITYFLG
jgi:hypothetical protein